MRILFVVFAIIASVVLQGCALSGAEDASPPQPPGTDVPPVGSPSPYLPAESPEGDPRPTDVPTAGTFSGSASESGDFRLVLMNTIGWDRFKHFGHIEIFYPQVLMPNQSDSGLEEKINDTILEASTDWITDEVPSIIKGGGYPVIMCHSNRYLSFGYDFGPNEYHTYTAYHRITVDMQTGERVMLDDLVDINDEFLDALYEGSIVYGNCFILEWHDYDYGPMIDDSDELNKSTRERIRNMPREKLMDLLNECSTPWSEYTQNYAGTYETLVPEFFLNRASFHVESGRLYITFPSLVSTAFNGITLYLDDIEEFLKVPKW